MLPIALFHLYLGSISDVELTQVSGFIEHLIRLACQ